MLFIKLLLFQTFMNYICSFNLIIFSARVKIVAPAASQLEDHRLTIFRETGQEINQSNKTASIFQGSESAWFR
jgi:hypothetical protein